MTNLLHFRYRRFDHWFWRRLARYLRR